jgi:hypothetical protein
LSGKSVAISFTMLSMNVKKPSEVGSGSLELDVQLV